MANGFMSFLKKFGEAALKVITLGAVGAEAAAPFVAVANPSLGRLLTGSASAVLAAETAGAAAIAVAPAADTGAQKAALAVQAIEPLAQDFCKSVGLPAPTQSQVLAYNNALVAALNIFGAVQAASAPSVAVNQG